MGACEDCKKDTPTMLCEIHNQPLAPTCKDCCINNLKGHSCYYWDLCWGKATTLKG